MKKWYSGNYYKFVKSVELDIIARKESKHIWKKNFEAEIIRNIFRENPKPLKSEDSFSRTGDNGSSKIISGEILPKDHEIFNAIGATEELLSYLGCV